MKKALLFTLILFFVLIGSSQAFTYSGSISPGQGLEISDSNWNDVVFSWTVDDTTNPGFVTYVYNWIRTDLQATQDLSHIDIEISPDFMTGDVSQWGINPNTGDEEIDIGGFDVFNVLSNLMTFVSHQTAIQR